MHAMPEGLNGIKLDLNESDMNDWFLIEDMLTKVKLDCELAALGALTSGIIMIPYRMEIWVLPLTH